MSDDHNYQADLVNRMLQEVFAIVAQEANQKSTEFAQQVAMQFLTQYVGTCVLNSLIMPAEGAPAGTSEAQKFALSWDNYRNEKRLIESAVGEAFRMGWKAYNPEADPEMLCQILTISDGPGTSKISH